jgi:hypothetical protein
VETINSRLSMLGVPLGLFLEATTGQGLWQQTADHPLIVAGVVALFTVATYVPILKCALCVRAVGRRRGGGSAVPARPAAWRQRATAAHARLRASAGAPHTRPQHTSHSLHQRPQGLHAQGALRQQLPGLRLQPHGGELERAPG